MIPKRASPYGLAALLLLLAAVPLLRPGAASASPAAQETLGELLANVGADDRRHDAPVVARYVSDQGESFVLDRSSATPLLRFQDSPEILVLTPSPAARGDIIYRDEFGQPVLRLTKLGGATLFAHEREGGAPVAVAGLAPALKLRAMSPGALVQRLGLASLRATRAARRLMVFDADEVTPGTEAVFADAAAVAAEAVVRLTGRKDGRKLLSRFNRILFLPGQRSSARLQGGVMNITVAPGLGLLGRPSSAKIIEAALGR